MHWAIALKFDIRTFHPTLVEDLPFVLAKKNMGLPLKNMGPNSEEYGFTPEEFRGIKASPPKNSIFFAPPLEKSSIFNNLPLENSMVPQPGQ